MDGNIISRGQANAPNLRVEHTTVAIVGAGPVGLITAIELSRRGLRPIVLEAKNEVAWSSRAICISRRSQEILDRIGAGRDFAAKALPWSRGRTFYRDRLVFRLDMHHTAEDRHAPFINLQQFYTERFLLSALESLGDSGEVRWGTQVTGVEQDGEEVGLAVTGRDGEYRLVADWVVAADGGRSVVREAMGLPLRGTAYQSRYLIADIEVQCPDWPVERHVWFDPPSNPGSTVILHVQPDGVWRIDYQLRDDEDPEEALRDERVAARLQAQLDMMGVHAPWRVIWKSIYKALALSLDSYRHSRVLFAGDAAHLVPIFGVRGLNSGIDDAHNLGWKLSMVARGEAPEALLDSYSHERRRATRENHEQATKSTWFMSPPGAGFELMRDAVLTLAADHKWASALVNPRQSSAHVYDDSPVIRPDTAACDAGVIPGAPLPNLPVQLVETPGGNGTGMPKHHLHDALPRNGFALLVFVEALDAAGLARLADGLPLAGLPVAIVPVGTGCGAAACGTSAGTRVIDVDGGLADRFVAAVFPLYLVRPDEHVVARFRDADPQAVADAIAVAIGHCPVCNVPAAPRDAHGKHEGLLGGTGPEQVFEALSRSLEASGEAEAPNLLARVALLLAQEVGDSERVLALIAAAQASAERPEPCLANPIERESTP